MESNGTGRQLLMVLGNNTSPAGSADGNEIAFVGTKGLITMHADGTGRHRLLEPTRRRPVIERPTWSPDGSRIVFLSDAAGGTFITAMDPDGTHRETVTQGTGPVSWAPDALRLAFIGARVDDVFTVDPDGTGRTRLTTTARPEYVPVFSPDGTRISFSRGVGGVYRTTDIWIMDVDGGSPAKITDTPRRYEFASSWQAT